MGTRVTETLAAIREVGMSARHASGEYRVSFPPGEMSEERREAVASYQTDDADAIATARAMRLSVPRPQTVHGHAIIDRKPLNDGSEYVLAHLPHNSVTPYVVWRMERISGVCEGGDYRSKLKDAAQALEDR